MRNDMAGAVSAAAAKTAPPAAISTLAATGAIDMTFWVGAATLIYLAAQLGYLLWKWRREARKA